MQVFWERGFAAASTDDLLTAMGIGRQSFYNAFGDKRSLYLEAMELYMRRTTEGHLARLEEPGSAREGIVRLLEDLVPADDGLRKLGCMGIGSVSEFGVTDLELVSVRAKLGPILQACILKRLREGQASGELDPRMNPDAAAGFIQTIMAGLQVAARGGAGAEALRAMARFAVERLAARPEGS